MKRLPKQTNTPEHRQILATAYPNKGYRWYGSIKDIQLEARFVNNRVMYYEISNTRQSKNLPESLVRELFPIGIKLIDRPFTKKGNIDFYTVLNRSKVKYSENYKQIKQNGTDKNKPIYNKKRLRRQ